MHLYFIGVAILANIMPKRDFHTYETRIYINSEIRLITKFNQWQNTTEVIDWFMKLQNKKNRAFIKFDIESFYPSITEETLCKAMEWAKSKVEITSCEEEIIMHSRRCLLF